MKALREKKINFIDRLKDDPRRDSISKRRIWLMLPVALLLLILLAVESYFVFYLQAGLDAQYDELSAYLNQPEVQDAYARALTLAQERDQLRDVYETTAGVFNNLASYQELDRATYQAFAGPAANSQVSIQQFRYERATALLQLDCQGPDPLSPSAFVKALRESGRFQAVQYSGYHGSGAAVSYQDQYDEQGNYLGTVEVPGGAGRYQFAVSCQLGAGEEAAQ